MLITTGSKLFHLVFFLLFFFISQSLVIAQPCSCSEGTQVKYDWEGSTLEFVLEGTDNHGITLSNVILDADDEPYSVDWSSQDFWVDAVCVKCSNEKQTTDFVPDAGSGTINSFIEVGESGYHSINTIVFCATDVPLPVELSSFTVNAKENVAELNWETATEVDNYGFEIQRSIKNSKWEKVGFVNGNGNSNSPKYYDFIDSSIPETGEYFYRLKQIDIDGQFEYSDVVNVFVEVKKMEYRLNQNYPNPFNPSTNISYELFE